MTNSRVVLPVLALSAIFGVYREAAVPPQLQYITTAHQAGPVGLRDPVGAVSPDGVWLAYLSNRHLFLHRIKSSSTIELLPADNTKLLPSGDTTFSSGCFVRTTDKDDRRSPTGQTGARPLRLGRTQRHRRSHVEPCPI